jgi:uncharacterized coiled-coil protein SlyX
MTDRQRRLTELEIRAMHQEAALETLGDAVVRLERHIEALEGELRSLQARVRALSPTDIFPGDEIPPHY